MAETVNIQSMAEDLAQEIFEMFGWERVGPTNSNWPCEQKKRHSKKQAGGHTSDMVFRYCDPHFGEVVYLISDLKSYKAASIDGFDMEDCLKNIGETISCAELSKEFRTLYVNESDKNHTRGLLFIYNNDGDYTKDFSKELEELNPRSLNLDKGKRLYVLSPARVRYLYSIKKDIESEYRPKGLLGANPPKHFVYPVLSTIHFFETRSKVASIETLLAPWQVIEYGRAGGTNGYLVYTDISGETDKEFQYLFDYLFQYQIAVGEVPITIRMPSPHKNAEAVFEKAKRIYAEEYWPLYNIDKKETTKSAMERQLAQITIKRVPATAPAFSETGQGMK
ncbi:MAG: hypothetical protein IAE94_05340 [Chthoniobacterales bacterium]|nr:hypothetical protein [Chthoniobacterales bacterium]